MSGLLDGIRVIESARLFNGDYVGMLLGDLGADVIKVEAPGRGDYIRDMLGQITPGNSPAHLQVNKNKRSVTLDLRHPESRELFWRLLATADVFVDGNAADACDRLGIGYLHQREHKPDIVYCQVSGFGSRGPYSKIPTHGEMMNALAAGRPREMGSDGFVHPKRSTALMGGTSEAPRGTVAAGVFAIQHLLAALVRHERTGQGCFIDVSGADAVIASAWQGAVYEANEARITDRSSLPSQTDGENDSPKYQFYQTRDRRFILFCGIEPKFWNNFCRAVDRADLLSYEGSSQLPVDYAHGDTELRRQLQDIFHTKTQAEWIAIAIEHDIAMGPALSSMAEVLMDPHFKERDIMVKGFHPSAGEFYYLGRPAIVEGVPFEVRYPAPALGEHTDEILSSLGVVEEELSALRKARMI